MNLNPYESPQSDPQMTTAEDELIVAEPADVERIGQLHYLLLGGGFLLAWAMTPMLREAFELRSFGPDVWRAAFGALLSAAPLAAVALAAWRRHERATTFPTQFGHWLLLVLGAVRIADFVSSTAWWRSLFSWDGPMTGQLFLANHTLRVCTEIAVLFAAWRYSRGQTFWRAYVLLSIVTALWVLSFLWLLDQLFVLDRGIDPMLIMRRCGVFLGFLTMLSFLVAGVRDVLWHARGKDPLHWLGIALQLLVFAQNFLGSIWYVLR
jgi:hypothetical protein